MLWIEQARNLKRFMNSMKSFFTTFLLGLSLLLSTQPVLVAAQTENYDKPGLVHCEGALKAGEDAKVCNFNEFINTIRYLINWMIYISFPIVIVVFAWAGLLFMSANEGNISKAKGIFNKVIIGYAFMLGAWLIVHTILKLLVTNSDYLYFFK